MHLCAGQPVHNELECGPTDDDVASTQIAKTFPRLTG